MPMKQSVRQVCVQKATVIQRQDQEREGTKCLRLKGNSAAI